eukprot:g14986.t1
MRFSGAFAGCAGGGFTTPAPEDKCSGRRVTLSTIKGLQGPKVVDRGRGSRNTNLSRGCGASWHSRAARILEDCEEHHSVCYSHVCSDCLHKDQHLHDNRGRCRQEGPRAFGEFSPCLQLCHEARISTCHLSQAGECIWKGETKIVNPLILYFKENGTADEKLMADSMKDMVTREELVQTISLYENAAEKWAELKMLNFFLGCCASYKCCLWLFCIYYAIPKTGSSVLVALATDKRNDFMCTSFVILVTFAAAYFLKDNQELEDKVDPFVSLLLSFIIMCHGNARLYLAKNGWFKFAKWYDYMSWYPIGRPIGTTTYPGMQFASIGIWRVMKLLPKAEWELTWLLEHLPKGWKTYLPGHGKLSATAFDHVNRDDGHGHFRQGNFLEMHASWPELAYCFAGTNGRRQRSFL